MTSWHRPNFKLNDAVEGAIVSAIQSGVHCNVAAEFAGITERTFWNWMSRGEKAKQLVDDDPETELTDTDVRCIKFHDAVVKALADDELVLAATLKAGATRGVKYEAAITDKDGVERMVPRVVPPDPKLALHMLERKHWRRWSKHQLMEVTGDQGGPIQIADVTPTKVLLERLDQIKERELAALGDVSDAEIIEEQAVEG